MEEWKECKLGEIATITKLAGFEFTKYIKYNETGEIIALRALNLRNGRLDLTEVKHIDKSVSDALPRSKLYKGEILFTYTGNGYGDCALVDEDDKYHLAPNICKISPNKKIADSNFLFQTIRSNAFYKQVSNYIGGSSQPTIPMETIRQLKVKLPPLPTQQKISAILSSLDDKIELNNKINTNLEHQAQAIFKSWFVDFEPFDGKMPEGWKVGKLGDFVEIKRGGSPRPIQKYLSDEGYRWLKISDVTSLSAPFVLSIAEHIREEGLSKTVFLKAGSLVLSNSATPGIPKILDLNTCIHDGWLYFPKSQLSNEYLYLLFKEIRPKLLNLGNGSIFTNLKTDILKNFEISIPEKMILSNFQSIIEPIFKKMLTTQRETKQLEALRDTLLPKLMSGEIKAGE